MCDVKCSPAFKWLIIIMIPLTFGWKMVEGGGSSYQTRTDIAAFFSRQNFEITEQTIVADNPVTIATAGACRIIVIEAAADGSSREIIRHIFGPTEHQFVVFRGKLYTEQPTWLAVTDEWWSRNLRKLGLVRRAAPVFAVSASATCEAELFPWDKLS